MMVRVPHFPAHPLHTPRAVINEASPDAIKAPHYAANFKNIVRFVNQCFFIMDAITVTACNAFFSF